MACSVDPSSGATVDLRTLIINEANAQGVDASIALAVASQESSICHWDANGNVVTGSAGEIGIFQLLPSTASQLGVNPYDLNQNIHGGILYLKQLATRYGDWNAALQAYNSGSPTGSPSYAQSVLAKATSYSSVINAGGLPTVGGFDISSWFQSLDPTTLAIVGVGAIALLVTLLD